MATIRHCTDRRRALRSRCWPAARPSPSCRPACTRRVEVGAPLKSDVWKAVATAADEDRIARLGLAWQEALADARKTNAADIRHEGKLLLPRAALPRPAPTPGSYNCRLIKLGKATRQGQAATRSFKPFFCYVEVEDDLLTIVKQTGSQRRPGGCGRTTTRPAWSSSAAWRSATRSSRWLMATTPSATWPACSSGSGRSDGGWSSRGRKAPPSSTCSS